MQHDYELAHIDTLLGTRFRSEFPELLQVRERLRDVITFRDSKARVKLQQLEKFVDTPFAADQVLKREVLRIEKVLAERYPYVTLSIPAHMTQVADDLMSHCTSDLRDKRGMYIKELSLTHILEANPPHHFLALIGMKETEHMLELLDPFHVIALTRHTEPRSWQQTYLHAIAKLDASHFERREVRYLVLDSQKYGMLLGLNGHSTKPWRMSHSKEAGVITCFTHDHENELPAPLTMFVAVLLHYYFETFYSGLAHEQHAVENPSTIGHKFVQSISATSRHLDFFNPFMYSESLYWDKALTLLYSLLQLDSATPFVGGENLGTYVGGANPTSLVSLNVVDHLWDINVYSQNPNHKGRDKRAGRCLYHFRELYWYHALRELLEVGKTEYTNTIVNNLHHGDYTLTKQLLRRFRDDGVQPENN